LNDFAAKTHRRDIKSAEFVKSLHPLRLGGEMIFLQETLNAKVPVVLVLACQTAM